MRVKALGLTQFSSSQRIDRQVAQLLETSAYGWLPLSYDRKDLKPAAWGPSEFPKPPWLGPGGRPRTQPIRVSPIALVGVTAGAINQGIALLFSMAYLYVKHAFSQISFQYLQVFSPEPETTLPLVRGRTRVSPLTKGGLRGVMQDFELPFEICVHCSLAKGNHRRGHRQIALGVETPPLRFPLARGTNDGTLYQEGAHGT